MIRQIRQRRQQARQVTDTENRRETHKTCKKNKTLGARGRKKPRALLPGTQVQKHLSRARQWALVDGGKGGGRERREGGGEHKQVHTSTNGAQQDTKEHNGRKETLHGGNPKVGEGRSPDICQGEVGGLYIQ